VTNIYGLGRQPAQVKEMYDIRARPLQVFPKFFRQIIIFVLEQRNVRFFSHGCAGMGISGNLYTLKGVGVNLPWPDKTSIAGERRKHLDLVT
jgi:hypothetical protein